MPKRPNPHTTPHKDRLYSGTLAMERRKEPTAPAPATAIDCARNRRKNTKRLRQRLMDEHNRNYIRNYSLNGIIEMAFERDF